MKLDQVTLDRLLREGMSKVRQSDLGRIVRRSAMIRRLIRGPLADIAEDVTTMINLVRDYYTGRYRETPFRTIAAAAFALLYILNPFDLIPDYIPVIGYLDDAAVTALVVQFIRRDLDEYRTWSQRLMRKLRHLSAAI